MRALVGLVSGLFFGAGLALSDMTNPAKVLGFLDLFGAWDPSLAFVMVAAVAVTAGAWALARRRQASFSGDPLPRPAAGRVDARLLLGAALFGLGWGLVGLCPGPALAALVSGSPSVVVFVAALVAGAALQRGLDRARTRPA